MSGGTFTVSCPFGYRELVAAGSTVTTPHGIVKKNPGNSDAADYINNGDGALSDTFQLTQDDFTVTTFTVTVGAASSLVVTPASLGTPAVGVPFSQQLSTSGGVAPYTYSLGGGSLPPGFSISPTGLISGTSTGSGPYTFTVHVVDSTAGTHLTVDKSYNVDIPGPTLVVSPTNPPAGAVGFAYSQQLSTSGGTAPYAYLLETGSLPAGLSLSSSGLISGTPSAVGTVTFKVRSTDSTTISTGGQWLITQDITIVINAAPTIVVNPATPTLPGATVASAYSATFTGSGGTGPYTFSISAGALPAGMNLNTNTGVLSGTPTAGGTFNFTVQATDSSTVPGPFSGTRAYALTVAAPTINLPATTLANGTQGSAYSGALNAASGGTSPYSYAVSAGALPPGVTLSSAGVLSGTPTAAGTYNFSATATDSSTGAGPYSSAPRGYSLQIVNIPPVANPVSAVVAYNSSANPITLNITGGVPTSVAIGTAAAHGTATASGTSITYTPTAGYAGPDTFTYTATNTAGTSAPATVTITVSDPTITVSASGPLTAQIGVPYTVTFTASGGAAPYALNVVGPIPSGLSQTGTTANSVTLSGTLTQAGNFSLTVSGTDSSSGNGPFPISQAFTLTVNAPTLSMTPPAGTLAVPYGALFSQQFSASGGVSPYAFALTGTLPTGLSFDDATGLLSGTATQPGSFPISVKATDSATGAGAPFSVTSNYTLNVGVPTITIAPATLTDATAGSAYTPVSLVASGGIGPYTFSLSAGPLPNGMSLTTAGVLSGTPTQSGTFPITVQAQDANGQTGTQSYSLQVLVPGLTVSPASLPSGVAGTAYSQTLSASGGNSPYSFAVTSGTLPAGITLTGDTLAGTPTVAGSFSFTVTATDSTTGTAATGSRPYTLIIAAPTITLAPTTLPAGQYDVVYSQAITASGGTAPYSYVMTGTPPAGVTLSSAGVLSGTPAEFGSFNITVTATDSFGFTGAAAYTLVIGNNPPVANPDTAQTIEGQPVTIAVTGNDTGTITSIAITTGPAHGTASVSGTDIVYTPAVDFDGTDTLQYTATGPGGTSTPATVTINVRPLPTPVAQTVTTVSGKAVTVDLTKDAVGGPFTSAALVSVPPPSSGTTVLNGFQMTFTPTATYQGTTQVTFTLSNAYATSAVTMITIEVVERADPTLDSEVMGILKAQTEATRRFATSQIGNFQQRLEGLHDSDNGQEPMDGIAFMQGIVLSFDSTCNEAEQMAKGPDCGRSKTSDKDWPFKSSLDDTTTSGTPGGFGTGSFGHSKVTIWTGGSINIGERDGDDGYKFETTGLSGGIDYRFSRAFAMGLGMGYGRDSSDIGDNGSRSKGTAYTAGLYASYHPGQDYFIDGLVGYQWLSFDSKRYLTGDGGFATGERDGGQWFASISAGKKFEIEQWQISPYARLDIARAKLDAFTEDGDPSSALHYGEQDISTTTGNLGLTLNYKFTTDFGVVSPQLRLEYQHDFQGDSAITMNYADMFGGPTYHTSIDGLGKDRFMLGLGLNVQTVQDFNMRLEYRGLFGSDGDSDNGFLVNLGKTF